MEYKKVTEIVKAMSLEEKASLLSGKDFWQTRSIERLGVPGMFLADGPHGIRRQAVAADHLGLNESVPATCFPTAATVANSWDTELAEMVGRYLGAEAAAQRVNVLLGPGMNIKRNPLCGRNFEYFSEDPHLTGHMAAAYVRGIQSHGVAACIKHFAVNNQETRRMTINAIVDERTLRELYLTGFEIAVKEGGTRVLMTSYNRLNGEYTNENKHLMREILRDEWAYKGCVVTDWGGGNERSLGLLAGNELEMPGTDGESDREIVYAVRNGLLKENIVDESVARLIQLSQATSQALSEAPDGIDIDAHHEAARKAAEESIVLLKNDGGLLPLDEAKSVAVIGDFAAAPRYQGAGSSRVNPTRMESSLDSLEKHGINSIGYAQGFHRYGKKKSGLVKKACLLASRADTVLLYLGLDEVTEAEGLDRENLCLPENQIELLKAISEVNSNIVVVLSCGSVVEMPWIHMAPAVIHGYLGGQAGAEAMLRVLTGKINPSGKLAETYPLEYSSVPSSANFPGGEATVEYREALYVGYRYFDSHPDKVLFPFGYGLSYTSFAYRDLEINGSGVDFIIENTGTTGGAEIAQLYIHSTSDEVFRPTKELKGFAKIYLEAGESRKVHIPFDERTFRFYNVKKKGWDIESGNYTVMIGASSTDIRLQKQFAVAGSSKLNIYFTDEIKPYFSADVVDISSAGFEKLLGRPVPEANWNRKGLLDYNDPISRCRYAWGKTARCAYWLIVFSRWFLRKIGKRDTANLITMSFYNQPFRGIAKMMGGMITRPMAEGLLLMTNSYFIRGLFKFLKENKVRKKRKKHGTHEQAA